MHIIKLIIVLIMLQGCLFAPKNHRQRRKIRKTETISQVLKTGKKIEYKNFSNWENHYLDDIKFDIYEDSKGTQYAIYNGEGKTLKQSSTKTNSIKDSKTNKHITTAKKTDGLLRLIKQIESIDTGDSNIDQFLLSNIEVDNVENYVSDHSIVTPVESENEEQNDIENVKINDNISIDRGKLNKYKGKKILSKRGFTLIGSSFSEMKDWNRDRFEHALLSFSNSCDAFSRDLDRAMKTKNLSLGKAEDWYKVCKNIKAYKNQPKQFFEDFFIPVKVRDRAEKGTFTGYYEFDLNGSREKTSRYKYPIYARPNECKDRPCDTRKEIYQGSLNGRNLELFWAEKYMDIFFLEMQGSGIIKLPDGSFARAGFGGTNRQSGFNIFPYLKKKNIPFKNANLKEMLDWLESNPEDGMDIVNKKDSIVFFRELENNGDGAIGAQGVPLTPSRSVAVDNEFLPYGVPVWIETPIPVKKEDGSWLQLNRLWVAQDTGSAIKGYIRADLFWGHGTKARYLAHKMKFSGEWYLLIPVNVIDNID